MTSKKELIKNLLTEQNVDAVLLYSSENRYWYSRFKSSLGFLIITKNESYLFLDGRYITMAKEQTDLQNIDHIELFGPNVWEKMNEVLKNNNVQKIGFEADWIKYQEYLNFQKHFANQELVPIDFSGVRQIKDEWEISQIQKACDITNQVFEDVLKWAKPEITEKELARFVSDAFFAHGADKLSFDTIVASGKNGSKPHAVPTDKKLVKNELITLDMGCYYNGYVSDQTRTFMLGEELDPELQKIYDTVYQAQSLGISLLKDGANAGEIHQKVAEFIAQVGYEGYFDHGLGHGIGVEIHEEPYENATSQSILKTGMTVTVEPGIYIPGVGGIRIEDDFLITENGVQALTSSPRELIKIK